MTNGALTPTRLAVGLGALSGSGVMKKGNQFNLQGAIMGGALAYGASQLTAGAMNAADPATNATTKAIEEATKAETGQIAANLGVEGAGTGIGSQARMLAEQNAGFGAEGLKSIGSGADQAIQSAQSAGATIPGQTNFSYTPSGEMVPSNISADITGAAAPTTVAPQPTGLQSLGTNLADAGKGTLSNIADAGKGIANLTGFGDSTISNAYTAFKQPITQMGLVSGVLGAAGLSELENQKQLLQQNYEAGNIVQSQYDAELARINEQIATANQAVSENPFNADPDRTPTKTGTLYATKPATSTLYDRSAAGASSSSTLYASGGSIDDQTGTDDGDYSTGYASGGMPRFLSGGGDGMSDSIKANIGGVQEARLADGEFVIPADVVSHIGNGSSKAGAKQLYSMMDRVRSARTGNKKQGKQINPRKYMAA
jgi:hypothetical protein